MQNFFRKYWRILLLYFVMAVVATFFVLIFSYSTSPIYRGYYSFGGPYDGGDSMHFQTDGFSWLHGQVPYRDFFDHKGPLIFLINMIGFWLGGGSRYGIVVLQIIALTITLIFIWKISQLVKRSGLWGWMSILVTLVFLAAPYNVGNSVQEYHLPFIIAAMYFIVKYLYAKKQGEHNPWWAALYGVSIGSCLLLQITDVVPIAVGVVVIAILLIRQKLWNNLWQNFLYGLAGFLAILLPFVVYFLICGAFGDFIYVSVIYNFEYAARMNSWIMGMDGGALANFIIIYMAFFCGIGATILAFVRKKWAYAAMLAACCVLETYLFTSGQAYSQYIVPFIYQIGLFLNEIILFEHRDEIKNIGFIALISLVASLTYQQCTARLSAVVDQYRHIRAATEITPDFEPLINRHYGEIQESSLVTFLGEIEAKGLYVRYKIIPHGRFPLIQAWLSQFSDRVKDEIHGELENNRAEFLLTTKEDADDKLYGINDILDRYYKLIDSNGKYRLYRLKEAN